MPVVSLCNVQAKECLIYQISFTKRAGIYIRG